MGGPPGPFTECNSLCADDRWISSSRPALRGPSPGQSALDARSAGRVGAWIEHPGTDPGTGERRRVAPELERLEHPPRAPAPPPTEARKLPSTETPPPVNSTPAAPELEHAETG